MFAIITTGGKQYRVAVGDTIKVEKLPASGKSVTFSDVLMVADGQDTKVGTPTVAGAVVTAESVGDGRSRKVVVRKFKSKIRYRRVHGHRQHFSQLKITAITV